MSTIYYEVEDYGDDFLMHHGIKGMKWGVRRTAEQLGHYAKKAGKAVYKTAKKSYAVAKDVRAKRIEQGKNNAIATSDYKKISKYQKYMSDEELKQAKARMETANSLKDLEAKHPTRSKRIDKKVQRTIQKGDYKELIKYQKHMSADEYKQAFDRLDTSRKLKDAYDQNTVEKGIKVLETIGRVGKAVYTIKETAQGFRNLKSEKLEYKQNKREYKDSKKDAKLEKGNRKDPLRDVFREQLIDSAKKAGAKAFDDTSGSTNAKIEAQARAFQEAVNLGTKAYNQYKNLSGGKDSKRDIWYEPIEKKKNRNNGGGNNGGGKKKK